MKFKHKTFLSLGSNRGDRAINLEMAMDLIGERIGEVTRCSLVHETEPWGFRDDIMFLNQVLEVMTELEPWQVMEQILGIEKELGRIRIPGADGYMSRTIDIDILLFDDRVMDTDGLIIPHPMMHRRCFILEPLAELEPGLVHPVLKKTVAQLLENCNEDPHAV